MNSAARRPGGGAGDHSRQPAWVPVRPRRRVCRGSSALYSTEAAFAVHREQEIGTLEPGKLADFVILDRNPMDVEPERIADIGVLAPIVSGRPAYQSATIVPEA